MIKRTNLQRGSGRYQRRLQADRTPAAIKPTPSIARPQSTVNIDKEEIEISIKGRHDPIIVPRAVVVVESMTALTLADLLLCNMCSRLDSIKNFYQEEKDV